MILLNSQISLYYNLRNLFLILGIVFVLASIGYGVHVHILVIVQKYFGIEKRREIAKRRAVGYTGRSSTAKMRSLQHPAGRSSRMAPAGKIDVSQVKTEKMKQSGTMVLSQNEDTMVLSQRGAAEAQSLSKRIVLQGEREILVVHGEDIC